MSADAFFRMGSTHSICQDYAVAGECWAVGGSQSFAIVSDGCSGISEKEITAAPFTDWGARLLVRAAMDRLGILSEGTFPTREIILAANAWARALDVPETSLDATLLVAVGTAAGGVQVFTTADGVVAWREKSGRIGYESVRFARGMPRYLSYFLDADRHARLFVRKDEDDYLAPGMMEITTNVWTPREGWGPERKRTEAFDDATPYYRSRYFPGRGVGSGEESGSMRKHFSEFPPYDVVALFSDGVESFQDAELQSVPLETVLVELLALKNLNGRFVTRRCSKFLENLCRKNGWKHSDDFSMAAVGVQEADSGQRTASEGKGP